MIPTKAPLGGSGQPGYYFRLPKWCSPENGVVKPDVAVSIPRQSCLSSHGFLESEAVSYRYLSTMTGVPVVHEHVVQRERAHGEHAGAGAQTASAGPAWTVLVLSAVPGRMNRNSHSHAGRKSIRLNSGPPSRPGSAQAAML